MAAGKRTLTPATYDLGAVSDGAEGSLIVQVENLGGGGSVEVRARSNGSGMTRVQVDGFNINDAATPVASIVANGLYKFPYCGGLDLALVVAVANADVATNFVAG